MWAVLDQSDESLLEFGELEEKNEHDMLIFGSDFET